MQKIETFVQVRRSFTHGRVRFLGKISRGMENGAGLCYNKEYHMDSPFLYEQRI